MKKKVLINEIVIFCFNYKVFDSSVNAEQIKIRIDRQLQDPAFIENLINTIFIKAKQYKVLGAKKVMALIIELEKLRLQLEDKRI